MAKKKVVKKKAAKKVRKKSVAKASTTDEQAPVVSVRHWMLCQCLAALPIINVFAILLMAFTGRNPSKKNYYKAIIAWYGILFFVTLTVVVLTMIGITFDIFKHIKQVIEQVQQNSATQKPT